MIQYKKSVKNGKYKQRSRWRAWILKWHS